MTEHISIEIVDVDGAIQETAEAAGFGRADFLRRGAIAGGGLLAGSALLSGFPTLAAAAKPSAKNDIAILNYALTLEYLEAAFYAERSRTPACTVRRRRSPSRSRRPRRRTSTSSSRRWPARPSKSPKFDFGAATKSQDKFLQTAYVLENAGVQAYLGQAGNFKNPKFLLAAASILPIEARHAGAVGQLINKNISPEGSFEVGLPMAAILKAVKGTGFIKG